MKAQRPLCLICGVVAGVYEPVIVIEHREARKTSLAREPELVHRADTLLLAHSCCIPADSHDREWTTTVRPATGRDRRQRSGSQQRAIPSGSGVSLLEADPEIGRLLTAKERDAASRMMLPVHTVARDHSDIRTLLAEASAIGLFVLEGMLFQRLTVSHRLTLRLLGPGDLYLPSEQPQTVLPMQLGWIGTAATSLALLDQELLSAARRWPGITVGLLTRMAQQTERGAVQLAVAHLPRATERLLAIMALLAERWGHATPDGTIIPLALTHETLGGLTGSRRPTVTIALSQLAQHDHLLKHDRGWLLRHQPRRREQCDHDQPTD